jgi:hypothetical protein
MFAPLGTGLFVVCVVGLRLSALTLRFILVAFSDKPVSKHALRKIVQTASGFCFDK